MSNCDKLNSEQIEEVKVEDDHEFNFITECFFITHTLIKIGYKEMVRLYNQTAEQAQASARTMDMKMIEPAFNKVFSMEVHLFAKKYSAALFQFLDFS